jgi:hypothetical protein
VKTERDIWTKRSNKNKPELIVLEQNLFGTDLGIKLIHGFTANLNISNKFIQLDKL